MASSKGRKTAGREKTAARNASRRGARAPIRLPRDPKGRRAQFYDDPAIDQLWAILLALTAEVSVAFDRIDTLERLLEQAGTLRRDEVEGYLPDESASEERNRRREALIQRVFQVLSQYEKST
jgi:hypothetical protein